MLKISTKLTLWYLLATAIVIGITSISMYYIYEKQRRVGIDEDLKDFADFLTEGKTNTTLEMSDIFNEMLERKDLPSIRQRLHRFALASNDSIIFETNTIPNLDSLLNVLEERNEFSYKAVYNTVSLNNTDYRTYSRPIKAKREQEYKLIIFTSLDKLYESLTQLRTIIIIIVPISLLFAGLIGFFIARRAFAPVRTITETAASISSQNLEKRVPINKTEDEISKLALTFNEMISRLDDTFNSQQRFIADASHDLRTPLTVVQMELELLLNQEYLDARAKAVVERCLREIFRLNELANNLMLLARADSHQLQVNKKSYRLDEQLLECLTQLKNLANPKNITFRLDINKAVTINADESMIRRALINALDNAIKYSPENEIIHLKLESNHNFATITVNNRGVPINPKHLEKIFDRFQRGDKSRTSKGFGLGLAIIKAIANVHNGSVSISSNKESGTTLDMTLPVFAVEE